MSVRRPFSPPLHSAAHYTRKHLHAGQRAAPPNHAKWADAKRVRSISTVRSVRFEPLAIIHGELPVGLGYMSRLSRLEGGPSVRIGWWHAAKFERDRRALGLGDVVGHEVD